MFDYDFFVGRLSIDQFTAFKPHFIVKLGLYLDSKERGKKIKGKKKVRLVSLSFSHLDIVKCVGRKVIRLSLIHI